jgi:hypothetical protein
LNDDVSTILKRLKGEDHGRPPGPTLLRKFDDGMDVQRRYIRYFREMGILVEPEGWDEDRGIRAVDHTYGIVGHIDCAIRTPEGLIVPVELKAYADELFKRYKYSPRSEHYHQLQVYLHLMGAPYGFLLPEDKNTQDINPVKCPRNEDMINAFLRKASQVWEAVAREVECPIKSLLSG